MPPRIPIVKDKEPRPNDLCPCGSGMKYKQCHGSDGYQKMMNQKVSEAQAEKAQDKMLDNAGKN